jgi:hypothetical protein
MSSVAGEGVTEVLRTLCVKIDEGSLRENPVQEEEAWHP